MSKPIEQRIGGPNSIRAQRKEGFVVEGSFENVNSLRVGRTNGSWQEITVSPVIITNNPGKPDEKVITIFKRRKNIV
jgi:hypothetical protein